VLFTSTLHVVKTLVLLRLLFIGTTKYHKYSVHPFFQQICIKLCEDEYKCVLRLLWWLHYDTIMASLLLTPLAICFFLMKRYVLVKSYYPNKLQNAVVVH